MHRATKPQMESAMRSYMIWKMNRRHLRTPRKTKPYVDFICDEQQRTLKRTPENARKSKNKHLAKLCKYNGWARGIYE